VSDASDRLGRLRYFGDVPKYRTQDACAGRARRGSSCIWEPPTEDAPRAVLVPSAAHDESDLLAQAAGNGNPRDELVVVEIMSPALIPVGIVPSQP